VCDIRLTLVQDKNPVTQVLRYAKPELQGFCPVLRRLTHLGFMTLICFGDQGQVNPKLGTLAYLRVAGEVAAMLVYNHLVTDG